VVRSGDIVVAGAAALTKALGMKTLFRDLSFYVRSGDRLAIVGPNLLLLDEPTNCSCIQAP
jgi:ATPase subunit of ABC transporter with duplicated ATPase domains